MNFLRGTQLILSALVVVLSAPASLTAQERDPATAAMATRAELEALLAGTSVDATKAAMVRARLSGGDFRAGDRIAVLVRSDSAATVADTLTVRGNQSIVIPVVGEVSLAGVLRSEVQAHLTRAVGRVHRNPIVTATPLVRLAVTGRVARPGYYILALDTPMSDVVMAAGGPTAEADLGKTVVRRDGKKAYDESKVRRALAAGQTLEQLDVRAGDEVVVGARSTRNWQGIIQGTTVLAGLVISLIALR